MHFQPQYWPPLLGQAGPRSIFVGEAAGQADSIPPCSIQSSPALVLGAAHQCPRQAQQGWAAPMVFLLYMKPVCHKKNPRWLLTAVAIEWDIPLCKWSPKITCSLFKQTYEKPAHFPHPLYLFYVLSAIGITSSAWPHLTSGGVGACVVAVLLRNSTPSSTISFQQQIFITGMHLGVLHPRGLPVCFRPQKHQEWEGEKKKKKDWAVIWISEWQAGPALCIH